MRIHKGLHYVVHVVNVNEDKKTCFSVFDVFNQHYVLTYFGQIKSFNSRPYKKGFLTFNVPKLKFHRKTYCFRSRHGANTDP